MSKKRKKRNARQPTGGVNTKITNTGYSDGAASRSRQALRGYNPMKSSPRADIDANLSTLRNRSSDMYINSPIGASSINTCLVYTSPSPRDRPSSRMTSSA